MRTMLRFLTVAALLGCVTAALAYPNFNATTGIIGVPNALIQTNGSFFGAADVIFYNNTTLNARAVLGLTSNLEAGAVLDLDSGTAFGISAKYRVPMAATGDWAVGLSFADTDEQGSGFQFFAVTSRTLTGTMTNLDLLGTLGVTFTDFEHSTGVRPFIGAQLMLPQAFEIDGEFELESSDFGDSIFSMAVRKQFSPRYGGELGFTNASSFFGQKDHDLFLGINIALPAPKGT